MEKWIIVRMQHVDDLEQEDRRIECDDLIVVDDCLFPMFFDSLEGARSYQEKYGVSGQCIEVPLY